MLDNTDGLLSLFIAAIEFVLIINLLIFAEKNKVNKHVIVLLFILGIYQFVEFLICGVGYNTSLWGYLAILSVSFMPPLSLFVILVYLNFDSRLNLILFSPALFFAFYYPTVMEQFTVSNCTAIYVMYNYPLGFLYGIFYYTPILAVILLLLYKTYLNVDVKKVKLGKVLLYGYSLTFIPAFIFTRVVPNMLEAVESIICTFAFMLFLTLSYFVLKNKTIEKT
ncbi:MAG: hypothetical protein V3V16_00055 [Melioribacteraceae bacterium]